MRRHLRAIGISVAVLIVVLTLNWIPANASVSAVDIGNGGLSSPCGVTVDGAGNVFVLDTNHRLIKKLAAGTSTWEDITKGQSFGSIYGITIDGSGNLYVADSSNARVMKLASGGSSWTSVVPPGGSGINLVPQYVAADPAGTYLYVADLQGSACRIWKVTLASNTWTDITNGTGLSYLYGLAVDGSGNVYATQNGTQQPRVVKLAAGATSWTTVMPWGVTASAYGIAVDATGNIYVSSDFYIYVMPSGGSWTSLSPCLAQTNYGIAADGAGNIYVARTDGKVTKITQTPPTMTSTYPTNGASNVLANKPITITFSDPIVAGPNFSSIALWKGGTVAVSCTREFSGNKVIITPDSGFVGGSSYSVTVPAGAVSFLNPLVTGFNFGFTVAVPVAPTVTSSAASNLTATTATLNGSVDSDGGANTTEYGFYWGTNSSTTTKVQVGGYSYGGVYTSSLGGLTSGATYYFKAYATNSVGTTYGALQSFTAPVVPTVTSSDASGVSGSSATLNGSVTSNGGAAVSDYGFYWGTDTSTPNKVQVGTDNHSGSFTKGLTGLSPATTYYFKAYATNSVGTAYGTPVSFATKVPTTTTVVGEGAAPFGQAVTITATVTSNSGTPKGTVTFNDGAMSIGPVTLLNGSATLTSSTFGIGTRNVTVVYTPDGSGPHSGSSGTTTQVILPATSGVTLQSSNLNTTYGNSVTFTATVTGVSYPYATPTGTVTFKDGTTTLGIVTASGGVATLTTSTLTAGTHNIQASYAPATSPADPYFGGSTSAVVTQQVAKATPTVTLTRVTGPATSVTGETVGFTAQVTGQTGPGPTGGTLTLRIGTRPPLTHDLANGSTFSVFDGTLTARTYTVTASFGGDANYSAADATPLTQTVVKADTATVLTTGNSAPVVGQTVTFTAAVSPVAPGSGYVSGSVTFYRDGVPVGSSAIDPMTQRATLDLTFTQAGSYEMTAEYGGDSSFNGNTASAVTQSVSKAATTVALVSSQNPSVFGQPVTFTATVAAVAPGTGTPGGTVTFYDGASALGGAVALNGSAQASLTIGTLAVGNHSVTAVYSGSSDYAGSSSPVLSQTVNQANTALVITSDRNPARWSDSVTFTVTVSAAGPGAGVPSGQITLTGDGLSLNAALSNGQAQISTAALNVSAGTGLTATYGGDSSFAGSSGTLTQVTNPAASATVLAASPGTSVFGQAVTLAATVTPVAPSIEPPVGTVTFYDGASALGSPVSLFSGSASLTVSTLSVGPHNITAVYSGAAHYAGSTSAAVTQTVNKAGTTVSLVSDQNTPTYGNAVTLTAAVSAAAPGSGTATGTVTFYDGAAALGSPVNLAGGSASLILPSGALSAGSHALSAVYSGDSNFSQSAQPGSLALAVGKANGSVALTIPASGTYDTTISLVAGLTPAASGRDVHFRIYRTADGAAASTEVGTATTTATGEATLSYKVAVPADAYTIVASFPGDSDIGAATQTSALTVSAKPATLSVQPLSANHLDTVTLSATLTPGVAGKTVSFTVNGTAAGTGTTDVNGEATCSYIVTDHQGTVTVAASFSSDGMLSDASGSANLSVSTATGALVVSSATGDPGSTVSLAAALSPGEAGHTISFAVDGSAVGSATTGATGVSTLSYTLPKLAKDYVVTASYAGDADIAAASGNATLTVRDVPPVFDLTNYPLPNRSDTEGQTVTGFAVHAVDPNGGTVIYSATGLPSGIAIDGGTGAITGTIAGNAAGSAPGGTAYSVTIRATDSAANTASRTFTWTVRRTIPAPPPVAPPTTTTTGNTTTVTTTADASTDSAGKTTATVSQAQVSEALSQALADASQQGEDTQVRLEIKVDAPSNTASVETRIPEAAVAKVAEGGTRALTVSTPVASITFDSKTLSTISDAATGDVKVTVAKADATALPRDAQQAIGDRPVFNFSVTSGSQTISQFGGSVEVTVPYAPKPGEDTNAIVIYYVDAQGKLQIVSNCAYDPVTGAVVFTTNHFSQYAVGYNKVTFRDVATGAWYANAVDFVSARGIATGGGDGDFNPDSKLSRGQFLVMVMRAYGLTPDENPQDNFADAGNTYYTGYLAAAKRLGISSGVGDNFYAPEREISRQEMCTLLYNTLKLIGQLPQSSGGRTLADFPDAGKIAPWANEAMAAMVANGTVSGSEGMLVPSGTTSRAQMAQVLYNLLSK